MSRIRPAVIEDFDAINELSGLLGYSPPNHDAALSGFKAILDSDNNWVWVYQQQDQVLGWIHLFTALRLASPAFSEIGGMVVSDASQHQGIGRQLVEKAREWSRNLNLPLRVRCDTRREAACAFYRSVEFSELKTQAVFEVDD